MFTYQNAKHICYRQRPSLSAYLTFRQASYRSYPSS